MIQPPKEFRTNRLLLRRPGVDDALAILEEYAADPEVTRFLTFTPHESVDTVVEFLAGVIDRSESGEIPYWIISKPENGRPIGGIDVRIVRHIVEFGYVLGRKHWGNGFMPEAVNCIADWMLQQSEVYRLWAVCDQENIASARTLEKCGFEREGLVRRWVVHPNISPEPRDCYMYSRTR